MSGRLVVPRPRETLIRHGAGPISPASLPSRENALLEVSPPLSADEDLVKDILAQDNQTFAPPLHLGVRQRLRSLFAPKPAVKSPDLEAETTYSLSRPMSIRGGSSVELLTRELDGGVPIRVDNCPIPLVSPSTDSSSSYCSILKSPLALYR